MTDDPNTPDTDADADLEAVSDVQALRHEAASRRRALRAAEAERDALRARLDASDGREVQRLAATRMANPADLLLVTDLAALRGDDGSLDPDKAIAAIGAVLADRPHWSKPEPPGEPPPTPSRPDLHQGVRPVAPEKPSFGAHLKGQR